MRVGLTFDYRNKGVKKAQNDILALGKTALKSAFGITSASVAIAKLNRFLQDSTRAALADQKAQASLAKTLQNSGFGMAADQVAKFIDEMQLATGVSEDSLRPAFLSLFNAVGSVTEAQRLLNIALDVSASTGRDVTAVTAALGKAALGSNTAIQRLGLGISKADLATKSFDEVVGLLEKKFRGTAATAAETMGGKVDRLRIAVGEAKEEVGKGLIDAFDLLAKEGGQDIDSLNEKIITLGTNVGDFARGLAVVQNKFNDVANVRVGSGSVMDWFIKALPGGYAETISGLFGVVTALGRAQRASENIGKGGSYYTLQAQRTLEKQAATQKKIASDEASRKKKDAAADAARKRAEAAQRKRDQALAMKYDVERAGLNAALMKANDADTKQRLRDLLALNQDNYSEWANSATVTAQIAANVNSTATAQAAATAAASSYSSTIQKAADSTMTMAQAMKTLEVTGLGLQGVLGGLARLQEQVADRLKAQELAARAAAVASTMGTNTAIQAYLAGQGPTDEKSQFAAMRAMITRASLEAGGLESAQFWQAVRQAEFETSLPSGGFQPLSTERAAQIVVNVQAAGSIIAQQDLQQAVTDAVNQAARSGSSLAPVANRL